MAAQAAATRLKLQIELPWFLLFAFLHGFTIGHPALFCRAAARYPDVVGGPAR